MLIQLSASPEKTTDADLVARARAGDRRAYDQLVERHRDVVYRVAARIVGDSNADDVSQDAFVRAYYRLAQYSGKGPFRAWLLQVTRSVALNFLRRNTPEPTDEIEVLADAGGEGSLPPRSPASALESKERRERLEGKFRNLGADHRTVLVLRDVEGLSYAEIAEITEMPLGSVKGRLHRARSEMIDLLRRNTYDWELPDE